MRITMGNVHARIEESTAEEWLFARGFLSYENRGAQYRLDDGSKPRVWLLNERTRLFPSGLLKELGEAHKRRFGMSNETLEVTDARFPGTEPLDDVECPWLSADPAYAWQQDAVAVCLRDKRGLIGAGTGSGKTNVAVALGHAIPGKWLFLVHTTTLMNQAADRFESLSYGEKAGRIGDKKFIVERFTCATIQTIARKLEHKDPEITELVENANGVIVDECHAVSSPSYQFVLGRMLRAYWRFGLSGTPLDRTDGRNMHIVGALGPIIYAAKASKLIADGTIARPIIHLLPVEQELAPELWHPNPRIVWPRVYKHLVVHSKVRNEAVVACVREAEKPSLVFVKHVSHGVILTKALRKAGMNVEFVHGEKSSVERTSMVKMLERGHHDVLVASDCFKEGVDIPSLRSVVIASGGLSLIATIQKVGRGVRTDKGRKTTVDIFDVDDRGCKMLERHSKKRVSAYRREGYEIAGELL